MNFLIENWYLGVALLAILFILALMVRAFIKLPLNKQLDKVRVWLLYAVVEAEKIYGSKTGKIKLSYVYGLFIARFKWVATFVSFETFSMLVDEALEKMREMLETNKAVNELVNAPIKEGE